jgi:hypothetical protein
VLRNVLVCAVMLGVIGLTLAACGGSSKKDGTPTVDNSGPVLHLGFADLTESHWRDTIQFLITGRDIRTQLCPGFVVGSGLDAIRVFEANTRKTTQGLPNLTPVAADQEKASKILQELCLSYPDVTPPAGSTAAAATPGA